ncbi:MAG: MBL fold metallo-hydrolase [Cyanobacteria bacterium P01_C01_bin.89]
MYLTWFDSNSWLIEMGDRRVLLDPWLVGSLMFGNAAWFFKGTHPEPYKIPENIDLILLSQGLEDHAHRETLQAIDKSVPVLGSPNAAKVAEELGYKTVTALDHGDDFELGNLKITATVGSTTGPNVFENGYILRDGATGRSLYYEPHGSHPEDLNEQGPIDVAITPLIDLAIFALPIIKGTDSALQLAKAITPQVMLPSAAAGNVQYEGLLAKVLRDKGDIPSFQRSLQAANLGTQVLQPAPGQRVEIPLQLETAVP